MNAKSAHKSPNANPASAPILGESVQTALDRAAPIIKALGESAKTAKIAIDDRNMTRAFLLEFFKAQQSPLTFANVIDGLRLDGFKAQIVGLSNAEKRSIILAHLANGESVNALPEKLYTFARDNGLVDFAHKISGARG